VPELRRCSTNPEIDRDERAAALREILADADELLRNFVLLLARRAARRSRARSTASSTRSSRRSEGA
jgi:F0F1-type ATP synthase delta subunit